MRPTSAVNRSASPLRRQQNTSSAWSQAALSRGKLIAIAAPSLGGPGREHRLALEPVETRELRRVVREDRLRPVQPLGEAEAEHRAQVAEPLQRVSPGEAGGAGARHVLAQRGAQGGVNRLASSAQKASRRAAVSRRAACG